MAVKRSLKPRVQAPVSEEIPTNEKTSEQAKRKFCCCDERWVIVGWVLLLFGGLAHMLPEQMAPLMKWALWGISLQMALGVVSVILALNFLLED